MARGVCSCKLQASQLGSGHPTLLQGGDKNTLSIPCISNPYCVLDIARGGIGAPAELQTDVLLPLLSKEDTDQAAQQTLIMVDALKMLNNQVVSFLEIRELA